MRNAQNIGGQRGDLEFDAQFMDIFEEEQDACRNFGDLSPTNADDLVLDENPNYAISVLKNFFKYDKITLDKEYEIPMYL